MDLKSKVVFWLSILLLLVVVTPVVFYCYHYIFPAYNTSRVADSFFRSLVNNDFGSAFRYVAYFDEFSDLPPNISYKNAEKLWIRRVNELKQSKTYVKSYSDVWTYIDDGYPRGSATITVVANGRDDTYRASIHFARLHGEWKIQMIYPPVYNGVLEGLEYAISGDLRAER